MPWCTYVNCIINDQAEAAWEVRGSDAVAQLTTIQEPTSAFKYHKLSAISINHQLPAVSVGYNGVRDNITLPTQL